MRQFTKVLLLLIGLSCGVAAQTVLPPAQAAKEHNGHGYFFVAPGGTSEGGSATLHIGGGGEGVFKNGLGVGAELGYLTAPEDFRSGFGIFSVNGAYHFRTGGKVVPFVTGGYSGFFANGGYGNGVNFGGGVNYWFKERVGLRFEFRDHVPAHSDLAHFLNVRFGVTFR
jgi:hypothetical protein